MVKELSGIERTILESAVRKLNYVYTHGSGESLTDDETSVFNYCKLNGMVVAVAPAKFGEIYEIRQD